MLFSSIEPPPLVVPPYLRPDGVAADLNEVVDALTATGVVEAFLPSPGQFNLTSPHFFSVENQKSRIYFDAKDPERVGLLCKDILESVRVDDLDVRITLHAEEDPEERTIVIVYCLEFTPKGFWNFRSPDGGTHIQMSPDWTEEKARRRVRNAWKAVVKVCSKKRWKRSEPTGE